MSFFFKKNQISDFDGSASQPWNFFGTIGSNKSGMFGSDFDWDGAENSALPQWELN